MVLSDTHEHPSSAAHLSFVYSDASVIFAPAAAGLFALWNHYDCLGEPVVVVMERYTPPLHHITILLERLLKE